MSGTPVSEIILHDYFRSSAAYRVRIALNLKGVRYSSVAVNLLHNDQQSDAYRAINPQGLVPLLEIDGHRIGQSLAIIDYLDARFPDPPMVSKDPARRALTLSRALLIAADIHPINNLRVLRYLKNELGVGDDARDQWYRHWVTEGFRGLEAELRASPSPYLSGDALGLADVCLVPQMYNARRLSVPLDTFPGLIEIDQRLTALAPFAAAHPDKAQPE